MNAPQTRRKGWCPSARRPMETGDGLLARFAVPGGVVNATVARAIAALAARYGNGHIDLTSRGNLQLRGVTMASHPALLRALECLDLDDTYRRIPGQKPPSKAPCPRIGYSGKNRTLVVGIPYGRMEHVMMLALTELAASVGEGAIRLTPWRRLLLPGIAPGHAAAALRIARENGFITSNDDPRSTIEACPGAPACASALGKTRTLAQDIAAALPGIGARKIHVSGCAKGCAWPHPADAAVTATQEGYAVAFNAKAGAAPVHTGLSRQEALDVLVTWCQEA